MTKVTGGRTVVRETETLDRQRAVIVELGPRCLVVRVKGKRTESYTVPYDALLDLGRKIEARRAEARREGAA